VAEIGFDAELFGTAANNGLMIGEFAPKSRQLKLFRAFAETLSGKVAVAGDAAGLIRPIIERLSRKLAH
jgi:pilus assembly protein CpaE